MATKTKPPSGSAKTARCTNCGSELIAGARFCPECGRAVKLPGSRATFGPRYAAYLVDLTIIAGLWFVTSIIARPFIRLLPDPPADRVELGNFAPAFDALAGVILIPIVALLYFWICHARTGRTIGKRIVGLRVSLVRNGEAPGWGRALLRELVMWGPLLLFLGGSASATIWGGTLSTTMGRIGAPLLVITLIANPLMILFWRERRGLHDLAAGTQTIRE